MDFFNEHAVLFALLCAALAVGFGIYLTMWLLGRSPGNERMQEIGRAIQEGADAYLRRQYLTIAAVSVVDRKSTRLNSSHANISYAVFCLKKNNNTSVVSLAPVIAYF